MAETKTKSATASAPIPLGPTVPKDQVPEVAGTIEAAAVSLAEQLAPTTKAFMDDLLAGVPLPEADILKAHGPMEQQQAALAPFRKTLNGSLFAAELAFGQAEAGAEEAVGAAKATWNAALKNYEVARTAAEQTLISDTEGFITTYRADLQQTDAPSRRVYLYYYLREQVATSFKTYESTVSGALSTLITALGAALQAEATFRNTVLAAGADEELSIDTAQATFWGSVEKTLDPPSS